MRTASSLIRAGLLASIAFTGLTSVANAQTAATSAADEASDDLIIVTASKRSATLQDTPI